MLRALYRWLIHLHPRGFRERFTDEMLGIFDEVSGLKAVTWLFADGLASLFRQWILRPEFQQQMVAAVPSGEPSDVPLFQSLDDYKPRPTALLHGGLLSAVFLCGVVLAIGHSSAGRRIFWIGSHHPGRSLLPVDRSSYAEGEPDTVVTVGAEAEDPWRPIASVYFDVIRVLGALDIDRDLVISPSEIAGAPSALRRLDTNRDGKLSPEECGFFLGSDVARLSPEFIKFARRAFMQANPVLAALDANHDGEISEAEIANSPAALRTLDRNGDRSLSPSEVVPDAAASQAAAIFSKLDRNADGKISTFELTDEEAQAMREMLEHADQDHDGAVTVEELAAELRFREEKMRLDSAARAVGSGRRGPL